MSYKLVTLRIIILGKIAKGERHEDRHILVPSTLSEANVQVKDTQTMVESATSIRLKSIELIRHGNC